MIDNAVAHYEHLRAQGKPTNEALDHCERRFGVKRHDIVQRINGFVADHDATMEALAEAKHVLESNTLYADDLRAALWTLYRAITGESL